MDDVVDMIVKAGYDYEMHTVETEDQYILKMHRLVSKNSSLTERPPPVLLMHDMIGSSSDFVIMGKKIALAYLLFDYGYDVWMGNGRGNDYSDKHKRLNLNSSEYWDFSFHEIGYYDLPAKIDYILKTTNKSSLFYIGHSQGSTDLLVLLSMKPEYNSKIIQAHFMAPLAFMAHPHSLMQMLAPTFGLLTRTFEMYSIIPLADSLRFLAKRFCDMDRTDIYPVCANAIFFLVGWNTHNDIQMDVSKLPEIIQHLPKRISSKLLGHFMQLSLSGRFCQYDYMYVNRRRYNAIIPPNYDLRNVTVPIYMYQAAEDRLVSKLDVDHLYAEIVNVVQLYRVIPVWNHADFVFGKFARKVLYNDILGELEKAKNKFK